MATTEFKTDDELQGKNIDLTGDKNSSAVNFMVNRSVYSSA